MLFINYKGNVPQQRFYSFSVQGNSKSNKIVFIVEKQQEDVDLSLLVPYLKVQNSENNYYDKIELDQTSDDNFLYLTWEITRKSTHYRSLELQIAFENSGSEDVVWQTMMCQIELGETIEVNDEISEEYPTVLEQLEKEVHTFDDRLEDVEDGLEDLDKKALTKADVVNNLDSEETDKPLSANQGHLLNVKINNLIGSVYKPQGSITVASLNALDISLLENGYVYNMLDSGIITLGNIEVLEGDNVAWIIENEVGHWDKLSGIVDLSNYMTLNTDQTVTGKKNFQNGFDFGTNQLTTHDGYFLLKVNNSTVMSVESNVIYAFKALRPYNPNSYSLGSSSATWKDVYLSGKLDLSGDVSLKRNTTSLDIYSGEYVVYTFGRYSFIPKNPYDVINLGSSTSSWKNIYFRGFLGSNNNANYGLTLPDTTGWTANKEIATTDKAFNVINATDIVDNTLSADQYSIITNGKPTRIVGSLAGIGSDLFLLPPASTQTEYYFHFLGIGSVYNQIDGIIQLKIATKVLSIVNASYGFIALRSITSINDKSLNYYRNNVNPYASNTSTELKFETVNNITVSANTTYTLATAPTDTYPEYKANITNSSGSAIVLTFTGVTKILTNDEDNVVVSSNTITLSSNVTIECSIQNGKMIAVNFEA